MKNPTRGGACLVMGMSIIIILSMPCEAGPGGRGGGPGAPGCVITSPANNTVVRGSFDVYGTAVNGSLPLDGVQVRIDNGAWKYAGGLEEWSMFVDISLLSDGNHTIFARAADANMTSNEVSVTVIVRNSGPPVSSGFDLMCLVFIIIVAGLVAMVVVAARERRRL